jgi:hypothetical protein
VVRIGTKRMLTKFFVGNLKRKNELEGLRVTVRTILEEIKINGVKTVD